MTPAEPDPSADASALQARFEAGLAHHEAGRFAEAEALYRAVLDVEPDHAGSLHLLGLLLLGAGQSDEALARITRAVELDPGAAPFHNSLGTVYRSRGRLGAAARCYRRALQLRPESAAIASNLATVLREMGKPEEAILFYRQALAIEPDSAEILYNIANAETDLGEVRAAEAHYRASVERRPDHADALYNLGNLLIARRRWREAEGIYRRSVKLRPRHAATLNNLGTVLQELGFPAEAEQLYRQALALDFHYADAHYNLGCVCQIDGRLDEAAASYERALAINPDYGPARVAYCMAQLPVLYHDEAEIPVRRARYEAALDQLREAAGSIVTLESLSEGIGATQPFFLAYQGEADLPLQRRYGDLACRILAAKYPEPLRDPGPPEDKIRVGIVSGFFHDHTVWKLFIEGWVKQLDRTRFEVFGYHTGNTHDDRTVLASGLCQRFVEGGRSTTEWRQTILDDAPHLILYPDIGMDPMSGRLAALRLAPLQYMTWGHPETTGYGTIDAFLSTALMEPPEGAQHYAEELILLPNLSTYFEPWAEPLPALGRADFGLREDATVYWSGQAIYKYHPRYDRVFAEIAKGVPASQFVFIEFAKSKAITQILKDRLDRAFAAVGLDAARHCVFLPSMDQGRFLAAVGQADVMLDTIGWSGGRSTLDCLIQDPVIVTHDGPLMRGRHTAGILRRMDLTQTIAQTVDDYVAIAVRLGRDPAARASIRAQMAARRSLVYRDRAYIRGLEDLIETRVRARYAAAE